MDVYAFGLVLYELISCKLPFQEISFNSQVEKKVLAGARPPLPDSCVFYEGMMQLQSDLFRSTRPTGAQSAAVAPAGSIESRS